METIRLESMRGIRGKIHIWVQQKIQIGVTGATSREKSVIIYARSALEFNAYSTERQNRTPNSHFPSADGLG